MDGDNVKALAEHTAQWATLLELETTPALENAEAAEVLAKVCGK